MADEHGAHFTIGPDPHAGMPTASTFRQCPLCVWISPDVTGIQPIEHPQQPFCDRCLDDLAALIKQWRRGTPISPEHADLMWPVNTIIYAPHPPSHGTWEPVPGTPGGPSWRRMS